MPAAQYNNIKGARGCGINLRKPRVCVRASFIAAGLIIISVMPVRKTCVSDHSHHCKTNNSLDVCASDRNNYTAYMQIVSDISPNVFIASGHSGELLRGEITVESKNLQDRAEICMSLRVIETFMR